MSLQNIVNSAGLNVSAAIASILGAAVSVASAILGYVTYRRFKQKVTEKLGLRRDAELETKIAELIEVVRPLCPNARQTDLRGLNTTSMRSKLQKYYELVASTTKTSSSVDDKLTDSKRKVANDLKDVLSVLAETKVDYQKAKEMGKELYYSTVDLSSRLKEDNERRLLSL